MKYWDSQPDTSGEQNSGAYIFRQLKGEYKPKCYSKYKGGIITKAKMGSTMSFYF
jgi:hypothetical protein